jgi:hypothetical protein
VRAEEERARSAPTMLLISSTPWEHSEYWKDPLPEGVGSGRFARKSGRVGPLTSTSQCFGVQVRPAWRPAAAETFRRSLTPSFL